MTGRFQTFMKPWTMIDRGADDGACSAFILVLWSNIMWSLLLNSTACSFLSFVSKIRSGSLRVSDLGYVLFVRGLLSYDTIWYAWYLIEWS